MDDDWDLQAVVRGCTNPNANGIGTGTSTSTSPASWFDISDPFAFPLSPLLQEDAADLSCSVFPDLLATPPAAVELEELCKPFYSKTHHHPSLSPLLPVGPDHHQQQQQQQQQQQRQQQSRPPPASGRAHSQMSRSKRRKNQQKRVVCQVPAEGLSSDMWAWRKYGQKPIKGSPYPRGYYRCSSSKGCLARKQVERSRADPAMFIITYTSEHNHPLPTHRNSLAGSTRHKYPENTAATSLGASSIAPTSDHPKACSPVGLSPRTPLTSVMDEHELLQKQEEEEEEEEELELEEGEMFMDLEELGEGRSGTASTSVAATDFEECFSDAVIDHFPVAFSLAPWLANSAATAAGGS